uniref:HhH-GPD domain-containing protein n=1 Tax=Thermofilum pendens TaxID=2269 RepID=A0A7C4B9T8_THEPE
MTPGDVLGEIARRLVEWYSANRRDFPWRVGMGSEWQAALTAVLLRKTKAETVAKHYREIVSALATPEHALRLGVEGIERILRPLGLHRTRARQIHALALKWSSGSTELPGLGPYARALIDCLAHRRLVPVLDVNTVRVVQRVLGAGSAEEAVRRIVELAGTCEANLALMDFAAILCRARKPRCGECPLRDLCSYAGTPRS